MKKQKITFLLILFICTSSIRGYGQVLGYTSCETIIKIDNSNSIDDVFTILQFYLVNNLGKHVVDGVTYDGPLTGKEYTISRIIIKNTKFKKIIGVTIPFVERDLGEVKEMTKKVVKFYAEICQWDYTKDPAVRYFVFMKKLIEFGKNNPYVGPYAFIFDMTLVYIEAAEKAINAIKNINNIITESYWNGGQANIIIKLKIKEGTSIFSSTIKPSDYAKYTKFEFVDELGNAKFAEKVSQLDINNAGEMTASTAIDKEKTKIFLSNFPPENNINIKKKYFLRITFDGPYSYQKNVVYIPIDNAYNHETTNGGSIYWDFVLYKTSGENNKLYNATFKL